LQNTSFIPRDQQFQPILDFGVGKPVAAQHHSVYSTRIFDINQRIRVEQYEVRFFAYCDYTCIRTEKFRGGRGPGLQCFEWRQSRRNKEPELMVQRKSRHVENLRRVGAE